MIVQSLNGEWQVHNVENEFYLPAQVPGTILGAFIENDVVEDPYYRDNGRKIADLFRENYEYKRTFTVSPEVMSKSNIDLVCFGLDTLTKIFLNGSLVAQTSDMHRTYRLPVRDFLKEGENEICIVFESPFTYIDQYQPEPGREIHYIPCNNVAGNQYLRKAHSMFGWDWAPKIVDCGIWRDIQIEAYDVRITRLSVGQDYLEEGIEVIAYVTVEGLPFNLSNGAPEGRFALYASLTGPDGYHEETVQEIREDRPYVLKILVREPQLWWPNGYGSHPLYELSVSLISRDRVFNGSDAEAWVSHKEIFRDDPDGAYEEGPAVAVETFARALGLNINEHRTANYAAAAAIPGKIPAGPMMPPSGGGANAVKEYFDANTDGIFVIGDEGLGVAGDSSYFARYSQNAAPYGGGGISYGAEFESDENGLFAIASTQTYGYDPSAGGYSSGEATPFDNETIGGGLFEEDDTPSQPVVRRMPMAMPGAGAFRAAPPAQGAAPDMEDVRKYERVQKSIVREDPLARLNKEAEQAEEKTEELEQEATEDLASEETQPLDKKMTLAEKLLSKMLVKKNDNEKKVSSAGTGAVSEERVKSVENKTKVGHVSIDEDEFTRAQEEYALNAVSYRGNEHHTAGQTVVSDTDSVMWILDSQTRTIGLRSIIVSQARDEWGEEFALCVNGVKIFARGGNYVPEEAIMEFRSRERTEMLIKNCVRANFNCLRVWGGGFYPDDYFYQLCDQYGIIVWQDCMFACNVYDANAEFIANVTAEIEDNARRIHHHACLGLWCGNNEIESAWNHWEGFDDHDPSLRNDYLLLFDEIIPNALAKESPMTFYWSSSPSSFGNFAYPDDENHGDTHYWETWHNQKTMEDFKKHYFRFLSEFGFQSYPDIKTLNSFTRRDDRNLFSKIMDRHQKDENGNSKLMYYISDQFLFPKNFESGVYLSQIMQGLNVKEAVDHLRRHRGRCMGALYWMVNDCWPGISWSGIDYFGRWKALQYMAVRFNAPLVCSVETEGRILRPYMQNETMNPVRARVTMNLRDMDFNLVFSKTSDEMIVPSFEARQIDEMDFTELSAGRSGSLFVETVFTNLATGLSYIEMTPLLPYKSLKLEDPEIEVAIGEDAERFIIHLRAKKFAAFVQLDLAELDAVFGDNYFHMTRMEHMIFLYKHNISDPDVTVEELRRQLVVRSLYDSYSFE